MCHTHNSNDSSYTQFINDLELAQNQIDFNYDSISKEYLCKMNFVKYFELFDKLYIDSNWTLESHYRHFGHAGRPLLLAFEKGNKLSDSIKYELDKSFENKENKELLDDDISKKLFNYQKSIDYMNCIRILDNKMGYFQFVVFELIGDNYCKFWHSNYGKMSIIVSKKKLKELVNLKNDFYYKFSTTEKKTIMNIEPVPFVMIRDSYALVEIVALSPWKGFSRKTFKISKEWPHKIQIVDNYRLFMRIRI